jgi:hypothetical protein
MVRVSPCPFILRSAEGSPHQGGGGPDKAKMESLANDLSAKLDVRGYPGQTGFPGRRENLLGGLFRESEPAASIQLTRIQSMFQGEDTFTALDMATCSKRGAQCAKIVEEHTTEGERDQCKCSQKGSMLSWMP